MMDGNVQSISRTVSAPKPVEIDDDMRITFEPPIRNNKGLYSPSEDRKIVMYIWENNLSPLVRGNVVWLDLMKKNIIPGRSWQSMKNRFLKQIISRALYKQILDPSAHEKFKNDIYNTGGNQNKRDKRMKMREVLEIYNPKYSEQNESEILPDSVQKDNNEKTTETVDEIDCSEKVVSSSTTQINNENITTKHSSNNVIERNSGNVRNDSQILLNGGLSNQDSTNPNIISNSQILSNKDQTSENKSENCNTNLRNKKIVNDLFISDYDQLKKITEKIIIRTSKNAETQINNKSQLDYDNISDLSCDDELLSTDNLYQALFNHISAQYLKHIELPETITPGCQNYINFVLAIEPFIKYVRIVNTSLNLESNSNENNLLKRKQKNISKLSNSDTVGDDQITRTRCHSNNHSRIPTKINISTNTSQSFLLSTNRSNLLKVNSDAHFTTPNNFDNPANIISSPILSASESNLEKTCSGKSPRCILDSVTVGNDQKTAVQSGTEQHNNNQSKISANLANQINPIRSQKREVALQCGSLNKLLKGNKKKKRKLYTRSCDELTVTPDMESEEEP